RASGPGLGDVTVDVPGQHVHRHVAAEDDGIVESPQVVSPAKFAHRALALGDDRRMADLVAAGLARPGAVAVDLAFDFLALRAVALDEEVDRLCAAPALV